MPWPGQPPTSNPHFIDYRAHQPVIKRPRRWPSILVAVGVIAAVIAGVTFSVVYFKPKGHAAAATTVEPDLFPSQPPQDTSLAAMNLNASDLPGWSVLANNTTDDSSGGDDDTGQCETLNIERAPIDEVDSPHFGLAGTQAYSMVGRFSAASVQAESAKLADPRFAPCLKQELIARSNNSGPGGVKWSDVSVTAAPRYAGEPANVVTIIKTTATLSTATRQGVVVHIDVAYIVGHEVEAAVYFANTQTALPKGLELPLIAKVAARVGAH